MHDQPQPLPGDAIIDDFTPDATNGWVVAYAGPCGDPECAEEFKGRPEPHARLYIIPMVGWLHAISSKGDLDEVQLRPAIMAASGATVDYLNISAEFEFLAVLRNTDHAPEVARELFEERHGGARELVIEKPRADLPLN